ncbi:intraflagellar transport protein 88 homolog [Octopus sinensis]|uniref:Intraflagellar transport protein 88 homolog n=1 Tax=Octopus sinensis TaxID=2607531 RepID=A0A6P7SQW1_9MOLL|nr:intraflagellar transport protein 88 homolog [Octopus sinensis]
MSNYNRLGILDQIHLAGEDEDDLYSGYNEANPIFDNEDLADDPNFQKAVLQTSHGRRAPQTGMVPRDTFSRKPIGTATWGGRSNLSSSFGRPIRTGISPQDGSARPMTAVRGAGYTSAGNRGATFDSTDPVLKGISPVSPLEKRTDEKPEEKMKYLEKKAYALIEESCFSTSRCDFPAALEKAKDAEKKEKAVVRLRKQLSQGEPINLDLTYSVLFNLASVYYACEMYTEALNTYNVIVKNKLFNNAGRLKVNIGNIYFKQQNYAKAIKFYRMALDQVQLSHKEMKMKIMQNIGISFVKMGKYEEAVGSFEHIMNESPSFKTGFNLILCHYALDDREKMKRSFEQLLNIDIKFDDEDKYQPGENNPYNQFVEVIKNDSLRQLEREKKYEAEKSIKTAAKIISPHIDNSFASGYDWCVQTVKQSRYSDLANDLEIDKAIMYLKQKDFKQAVETLKSFEKKDSKVASIAATNLSFLYFMEHDLTQAEKYADMAITGDRYSPSALVNKGNVLYSNKDYEKARDFYQEALQNDSSCVEALYNLGLSNKMLGRLEEALDCYYKLHAILRSSPQVMYQIADLNDQLDEKVQAKEWFMQLIGVVATDPDILCRLGQFYDNEEDKTSAFQYYFDSYRYFPSNIPVIEWLGLYYIESQFPEKAVQYFERAAIVQPNEIKWQLMVASCFRRSGNYQQALDTYRKVHKKFPDNVECLKFLTKISADLGLPDAQEYATKLKKAEKAKEMRDQRINSGRRGSGRHRDAREGSAGSERTGSGSSSRKSSGKVTQRMADRMGSGQRTGDVIEDGSSKSKEIDATYSDPLGPQAERPKTAARRREVEDEFADEEIEDLLPE